MSFKPQTARVLVTMIASFAVVVTWPLLKLVQFLEAASCAVWKLGIWICKRIAPK